MLVICILFRKGIVPGDVCFLLTGCISVVIIVSVDDLILICGHSFDGAVMVWTNRVYYYGHVVTVISVDIGRRLLTVYDFAPDSFVVIVIIVVIVILSITDGILDRKIPSVIG